MTLDTITEISDLGNLKVNGCEPIISDLGNLQVDGGSLRVLNRLVVRVNLACLLNCVDKQGYSEFAIFAEASLS